MALSFFQRRNIPDVVGSVLKGVTQAATAASPIGPAVAAYNSFGKSIKPNTSYKQPVSSYQTPGVGQAQASYNPQQTQQAQTPSSPDYSSYLNRLRELSEQQTQRYDARAAENARLLRESYGKQNEIQASRIPQLQQGFGDYKASVEGQIGDEEARALAEQEATKETYGEALRRSAQANRESQGQLQNVFAGLGTLDSRSFQNMMANQQAKFAGGQQSTLKQQARDITSIGNSLSDFKRNAVNAIRQEEQNLYDRVAQINSSIAQGTAEYETAIRQAYADAEDAVSGIEQQLTQTELSFAQQGQSGSGQGSQLGQTMRAEAANTISQILNSDTNRITGLYGKIPMLPGSSGQSTKALYDQLQGQLGLIQREYLKGTGTVTDWEAKTAKEAAAALNPNMSNEDFRRVLAELQLKLSGQGGFSSPNNGQAYAANQSQIGRFNVSY